MELPEILVHQSVLEISGKEYEVSVYARDDGRHIAKTAFGPGDIVINDGISLAHALEKHSRLLPLAVDSRSILRDMPR